MGRKSKRKSRPNRSVLNASSIEHSILENEDTENGDKSKLILITDRLCLPPYRNEDSELDVAELQLDIRPRAYFVSGLCYFCSRLCAEPEFPCEGCHMLAYCSPEHRLEDAESHIILCNALAQLGNGHSTTVGSLDGPGYRRLRVELVRAAATALARDLEPREREILLYPKVCRVCRKTECLERCPGCLVVYHCAGEHAVGHEQDCAQFRILGCILETERASGFVAPELPAFPVLQLPENFDRLVRLIFQRDDYERIDCTSYAALSQAATPPLTALFVMGNLPGYASWTRLKTLRIHIIGAELQFECANLTLWEKLFLHMLPHLRSLKLELYGPELRVPSNLAAILEKPPLCGGCRKSGRTLDVVFHCGEFYHEVVSDDVPDLVCLFNPGLYRTTGYANQDTWPRTIEKCCDHGVPIIVTSYTQVELPLDLERIRELREVEIELEPRRNPFASLRPERNFVSDDVAPLIYKNYYVGVARITSRTR